VIKISQKINFCKECGIKARLSRNHLCEKCGTKKVLESIKHLKEKKGYYYDKWLASNADRGKDNHD